MSRIESESARMGGLVDDLLTLARIDEVREPAREPLDLRELLEDVRDDARAAARGREISLTPTGPVATRADGDALRRVFANLLRNAIVHTPDGTPIEISLEATDSGVTVGVRDHGPGLPPGDPDAVFERFWRDSSSRGRDGGSAGLGLAIVAALVSAHGGTVEASNPVEGGALFTVRLPLL
jgi:two-component system, OmpR family, sensor kinase